MEYINEAKQTIRDIWFGNHVIKSVKGEEGFQEIIFGKPGTTMYQLKYVLSGNMLYVSGDLGIAAYELTGPATIEELSRYDLYYFNSKLVATKSNQYNFESKLATEEIRNYFFDYLDIKNVSELDRENRKLYNMLIRGARDCSNTNHFNSTIYGIYQQTDVNWFNEEMASTFSYFGRQLSHRVISHWMGLQMIGEFLGQSNQTKSVVV